MIIEPSIESPREDRVLGHPFSLYEHAVLHILVAAAAEAKKWQLLFVFVELLPLEVPPPLAQRFAGPAPRRR